MDKIISSNGVIKMYSFTRIADTSNDGGCVVVLSSVYIKYDDQNIALKLENKKTLMLNPLRPHDQCVGIQIAVNWGAFY